MTNRNGQWIEVERYTREEIRNSDNVFLFGDNEQRAGFGGQAGEARGEKNTIGVPTKYAPGRREGDYWSDENYLHNVAVLDKAFDLVEAAIAEGKTVVMPKAGLGTGLSELPQRAPRTFSYLEAKIGKAKG